jgi:hypothetical protein
VFPVVQTVRALASIGGFGYVQRAGYDSYVHNR